MFSRKYKKGIADAAKAYEGFGQKQEDAIRHILEEVRAGKRSLDEAIKELGGDIKDLSEYLKSSEKAKLYTVYTPFDIKELGDSERKFLVGSLFRLTMDKAPSEDQQSYLRAVQKYLDIKEMPFGVDPLAIENIEDLAAQKAILQTVLEYLRLQGGDSYDTTELQAEFLDAFSVSGKQYQAIVDHVEAIYAATGAKGLAEKYGYVPEDEEESKDIHDRQALAKKKSVAGKEKITISSPIDIRKGETVTYKDKIIHFHSVIKCAGNLTFDSCTLHYCETREEGSIQLSNTASFSVIGSNIECHGESKSAFIHAASLSDKITFFHSTLINCFRFFKSESDISFDSCYILNPGLAFVVCKSLQMIKCKVEFKDIPRFMPFSIFEDAHHLSILQCDDVHMCETAVINSNDGKIPYDSFHRHGNQGGNEGIIDHCEFRGIRSILDVDSSKATNTLFSECEYIFTSGGRGVMEDCRFDDCKTIFHLRGSVICCQFNNCSNGDGGGDVLCFIDAWETGQLMELKDCDFNGGSVTGNSSMHHAFVNFNGKGIVKNCIFNGIEIVGINSNLIHADAQDKDAPPLVQIDAVTFKNCSCGYESDLIFDTDTVYYGPFQKLSRVVKTISISNCGDLSMAHMGSGTPEEVPLKTTASDGTPVGLTDKAAFDAMFAD